jgi:hypothetical protein
LADSRNADLALWQALPKLRARRAGADFNDCLS